MNEIPEELNEIIDYLTNVFTKSINSPVHSKEDLSQDLLLYYWENRNAEGVNNFKDYWFIQFKNYLIGKYRRVIVEKKFLEKIKKEDVFNPNTSDSSRLLDL